MVKANKTGAHHEIAVRYGWAAKSASSQKGRPPLARLRVAELERIFADRYGKFTPDSPDGRNAVRAIAEHVAMLRGDPVANVLGWIHARAPWMPVDEARAVAERAADVKSLPGADTLAWSIGLTMADRTRLKIKTIGAVDFPRFKRRALRKASDRRRKVEQRRAAGAKPRAEFEASSLSQTKPWLAWGWSRAKWYRNGKPMPVSETGASTVVENLHLIADGPVSQSQQDVRRAPAFGRQRSLAQAGSRARNAGLVAASG